MPVLPNFPQDLSLSVSTELATILKASNILSVSGKPVAVSLTVASNQSRTGMKRISYCDMSGSSGYANKELIARLATMLLDH